MKHGVKKGKHITNYEMKNLVRSMRNNQSYGPYQLNKISIYALGLDKRAEKLLDSRGFTYLSDIVKYREEDLVNLKGSGKVLARNIKSKLEELGLYLPDGN